MTHPQVSQSVPWHKRRVDTLRSERARDDRPAWTREEPPEENSFLILSTFG